MRAASITCEDVGLDQSTLDCWKRGSDASSEAFQFSSPSWRAAMSSLEVTEFDGGCTMSSLSVITGSSISISIEMMSSAWPMHAER